MKKTFCIMMLCLACGVLPGGAQTARYACRNLQQLAAELGREYDIDCTRARQVPLGRNVLVVTQDSLRRVDHIGLQVFPEHIVRDNPSPVYRFVERYLLELYLRREQPTPAQRLAEDKVTLRFPGHEGEDVRSCIGQWLPRFGAGTSLVVSTDNNRYTVSIYEQGRPCFGMRFPIRYELLWGMNKREAENGFYTGLMLYRPSAAPAERPAPAGADGPSGLKPLGRGIYVLPGDSYQLASVNADRYYRLAARGAYVPLMDGRHAAESARNLFLLPCAEGVVARVTQRLYNRRRLDFEVPLSRLLDYCRAQGCRAYVGIETADASQVTGTVVLLNPSYGYLHQLYFQMPAALPDDPSAHAVRLELYAYVPTHNIGLLFQEESGEEKKQTEM